MDNKGKTGVYAWENKTSKKLYIGSGNPLYTRISDYYQTWYLKEKTNLYIVRSLNKYTMNEFNLHILEYSDSDNVILCEQKWIDFLQPEYNLNPIASNSKGYKHTVETIEKMKISATGRKHTEEVRNLMSENRKGANNPFYNKKHTVETLEKLREIALNRDYTPVKGLEV